MNRYKTQEGRRMRVGSVLVTDAREGVALPDSAAVREHVTLGRLVPVERAKGGPKESQTKEASK